MEKQLYMLSQCIAQSWQFPQDTCVTMSTKSVMEHVWNPQVAKWRIRINKASLQGIYSMEHSNQVAGFLLECKRLNIGNIETGENQCLITGTAGWLGRLRRFKLPHGGDNRRYGSQGIRLTLCHGNEISHFVKVSSEPGRHFRYLIRSSLCRIFHQQLTRLQFF